MKQWAFYSNRGNVTWDWFWILLCTKTLFYTNTKMWHGNQSRGGEVLQQLSTLIHNSRAARIHSVGTAQCSLLSEECTLSSARLVFRLLMLTYSNCCSEMSSSSVCWCTSNLLTLCTRKLFSIYPAITNCWRLMWLSLALNSTFNTHVHLMWGNHHIRIVYNPVEIDAF